MQQGNYAAAEVVYRKAQLIDPDVNKACNLCYCLIKQARHLEARTVLEDVLNGKLLGSDDPKSRTRAMEILLELGGGCSETSSSSSRSVESGSSLEDTLAEGLEDLMKEWAPYRPRRLPVFEEISPLRDQLACG